MSNAREALAIGRLRLKCGHVRLALKFQAMSDNNRKKNDEGNDRKGGEFRVPPRTYLLWIAIIGAIPLLMIFKSSTSNQADSLTQSEFISKVDSNLIASGTIIYDPQSPYLHEIRGKYYKLDADGDKVLKN